MNNLQRLVELGQSPWLDNLRRDWISDGRLAQWTEMGIRGLTSNPSIFQKAIAGSDSYDAQFRNLIAGGMPVEDAYWELVLSDIGGALEVMRPVHDATGGTDGFVSVEVDPSLADDTAATIAAARSLHQRIGAPNVMIKIPGTEAGLPAVRQMISESRSINVTLIFSVDRHREVMEAYLSGLEEVEGDLSHIHSVASFFVSRVDTEVDRRLEEIGTPEALALRGRAAVAQARDAYAAFIEVFSGERWQALARRGAHMQRPLWASTSTKNPSYPDTLYVDRLIGPYTVNTMPDQTIEAFLDHGHPARSIDTEPVDTAEVLRSLSGVGVDMADVAAVLERQGVDSFVKSFEDLIDTLTAKAESFS